ncbi:hypothetical protein N7468_004509 [Penicillium chermesinum]|uniref:Uncharacterized protein n=1 Tax=Penicillium chermesinum TaxID=63820 RepID=A0A9W9TSL9_9EURO|nr:uncharacterized protein N7468_004509 [Penicillium chermesinum]KAJ5239890.1 hypothetical protein N7468_004509 [Penicillium chermesinum]KAJ6166768.1 hypothetical protein N7470_002215 [Penicillium chermesinum]
MFFTNVALSAILATTAVALPKPLAPRDSGSGNVQIINNLSKDVYLWSTAAESGSMQTMTSGGGTYSEKWGTNSNGGGISIKMSTSQDEDSVLQFEYTQDGDTLYWDLSSINLDSNSDFITAGFSATPSDQSCPSATCDAGDSNCQAAYQHPDDVATLSCSTDVQYTLTLG